ncbi:MAG: glycosyl hydrolase [Burkholderiales bacterium]|nr:glycosyl hydrolase [Burkholderiales bacterium]
MKRLLRRLAASTLGFTLGLALGAQAGAAERSLPFRDPLALPASSSALAPRSLMLGVARAGHRLVAVGQRGHIVYSDDGGASWQQAAVPVSSDLTAVRFATPERGWAVGHDGVVLNTVDGGRTWVLQLDGRRVNQLLVEQLEARLRDQPASAAQLQPLLSEARRDLAQGPDKPLLDVWFADAHNGFVVGAYNLILRTGDGGASWTSWFDRTDNPRLLNLYAIASVGDALYIVGEAGLVLKLDPAAQRLRALATPYKGSYFGVVATAGTVLALGLRGTAYASDDGGANWRAVETGLHASLVAGAALADGRLLIGDAGGRLAVGDADARQFHPLPLPQALPLAGLVDAGQGRLALVGPRGVVVTAPVALHAAMETRP